MEEEWRDVVGFEGLYEISSLGRVKSVWYNNNRILKLNTQTGGYVQISLRKNNKAYAKLVHVLVMESFVSLKPTGLEVNHKDGIKTNNMLANLEYVTPKQNMMHAFQCLRIGDRKARGEKAGLAKLQDSDVIMIRQIYSQGGITFAELGREFGVHENTISKIVKRRGWGHVE